MLKEFKEFATRGSVIDLAIGIVIGAAFGRIVSSLVNDIIMPPIGVALSGIDFADLFITLKGGPYPTLAAAKAAHAPTINYGVFLNTVIDFLIVAFVIFIVVRQINKMYPKPTVAPTTRPCPYCLEKVAIKATRCPHCTSELKAA